MSFLEALGPTIYPLLMRVLMVLTICVIGTGLFFASKTMATRYKRRKQYKIDVVIFNPDGTFMMDKIGKFRTKDNMDKMLFLRLKESMPVIPLEHIRERKVCLWRYAPHQYAVIPPKVWGKNPEDFKLDIINLQMKNFAYLEQRAAVSRWAGLKSALQKWAPFITVVLILIFAGVAIWLIMKTGLGIHADVVKARVMECSKILGGGSAPIG
jgi:hypothetical protein